MKRMVKHLAEAKGVHVRTMRTHVTSAIENGEIQWNNDGEKIEARTELPEEVWLFFGCDFPGDDPDEKEEENDDDPDEKDKGKDSGKKKKGASGKVKTKRRPTNYGIFGNNWAWNIAAIIVMIADGVAFSYITYQGYEGGVYRELAASFFFLLGYACGYAQLWAVMYYNGSTEVENFIVACVFVFQCVLHMGSFEVFGENWSVYLGKIDVAMMIAFSGLMLPISRKNMK